MSSAQSSSRTIKNLSFNINYLCFSLFHFCSLKFVQCNIYLFDSLSRRLDNGSTKVDKDSSPISTFSMPPALFSLLPKTLAAPSFPIIKTSASTKQARNVSVSCKRSSLFMPSRQAKAEQHINCDQKKDVLRVWRRRPDLSARATGNDPAPCRSSH